MISEIYSEKILKHATNTKYFGSISKPNIKIKHKNNYCGDEIILTIKLEKGLVKKIAHQTKGCILCQAAASILSSKAKNKTLISISDILKQLVKMLEGKRYTIHPSWKDLSIFKPFIHYKNRHKCILLPFEAIKKISILKR